MQGVTAATSAKLAQLEPIGIVAPILVGRIVALFTFRAGEMDHMTHIFFRHLEDSSMNLPCEPRKALTLPSLLGYRAC
jgi:hypothetical protein